MVYLQERRIVMVPTIGMMIGAYIIIRMISFITRKGERSESPIVVILSFLNILFTLFLIFMLMASGILK